MFLASSGTSNPSCSRYFVSVMTQANAGSKFRTSRNSGCRPLHRTHQQRHSHITGEKYKSKQVEVKCFPSLVGPQGGADLCFISPQPDTSRSHKTTDTGLLHRVVCPLLPSFLWYSLTDPGGMTC